MTANPASAQEHTERGAVLGGLAGGLTGAAIGKHNGETAAGALLGTAAGLVTGALIGNSRDEQIAQGRARAYYQQQQLAHQQSRAVSPADVVNMTRSGLSEQVIITHIRQNGVQYQPQVSDVIALHQQGVSQNVITAMQQSRLATAPVAAPVRRVAPVIVEEHHYVRPRYCPTTFYYHPHHHIHRHHHHGHRSHLRFGISVHR